MKRFLAFGLVVGMILLVLAVGWVWVVALEDPSEVMANPPTKSPIADPQTQSLAGYQQDFEGMLGWFSGDSGTSGAPSPQGSTRKTKETPKNPPSPSSNAPSSKKDTSAPNEVEDEKKTSDTSQIPLGDLYNKAFTQLPKAVQGKYVTVEYGQGQVIPMDVGPEEQSSYAIPVEDFLAMTEDEREKALKDLLWRYWDAHPEKAPKPWGREDYAVPHTKDFLIPLRLWFPEWWFDHYDVDPCNDVVYWREVPACREVVKEQPTQSWLLNR